MKSAGWLKNVNHHLSFRRTVITHHVTIMNTMKKSEILLDDRNVTQRQEVGECCWEKMVPADLLNIGLLPTLNF